MEVIIKYWVQENSDEKKMKKSLTANIDGINEENKLELAYDYLCTYMQVDSEEDRNDFMVDFGIDSAHLDSENDVNRNLPETIIDLEALEKISLKLSVLIEKKVIDLSSGQRAWFRTRYGDFRLGILTLNEGVHQIRFFHTHEIYQPGQPGLQKTCLIEDIVNHSLIIKSTNMATKKKAAKKAAKPATKKATAKPAEKTGPTKKELVAKYLKQGKKPAEIVELMAKEDKVTTTLASVRCFVQAINNGQ